MPRGVAPRITSNPGSAKRTRLREEGFRDGRAGVEKQSTEPEYLTSYRRGREQKEAT